MIPAGILAGCIRLMWNCFLNQAGKLKEAGRCSLQSELIALQFHLVSGAVAVAASAASSASLASLAPNSKVHCVLGISAATANYLILHTNLS